MKIDLKFSFLVLLIGLFTNIGSVNALSNTGIFKDLTISDNGNFYNNTNASGANSNLGYEVATGSYGQNYEYEYYYAVSETETQLINYGITLTQCGMNLKAGRNYSIIYYFKSGGFPYIYPNYANTTYKLGISNDVSTANLSFNPSEWYADNIGTPLPGNFNTVHSFILTFEAPTNGACLSVSYSSKTSNVSSHQYLFLGYELTDHGQHVPTVDEIKDGLESSFDDLYNNFLDATISINNAIDAMHDHLNGNINASTNEILDKQEETNQALGEIKDMDISEEDKELPDDTEFNNYQDAEDDLMDKVNEADMSVLDVAIDVDSSNFVWDTLTDLIQSHTLIFSTIIAILSIGIIKLALGR